MDKLTYRGLVVGDLSTVRIQTTNHFYSISGVISAITPRSLNLCHYNPGKTKMVIRNIPFEWIENGKATVYSQRHLGLVLGAEVVTEAPYPVN